MRYLGVIASISCLFTPFKKMMESSTLRPSVRAITFNVVCLVSLILIVILFSKVGKPYHRGFFCDDNSIRKPFKKGTVSAVVAAVVGLLLPIIVILVIEIPRFRKTRQKESKPFYKTDWFRWLVVVITFFAAGAGTTAVLTDSGKYTIGRLRPHFLDVCKPDYSKINCSKGFGENFITDDVCTGDAALIREARLSFPSGHASFSAYCMMFLIFYVDIRMTFCSSLRLLKPLLQMVFLLLALLCGMSRVSDYKHHWSDVLAGLILGTLVAIFFMYRVLRLHRFRKETTEMSSSELGAIQRNTDPEKGETSTRAGLTFE